MHAPIRKGRRWMVVGGHGRRGPTQVRRTKREGMNECLHSKVAVDLWSGWWCVPLDPVSSHVSSVATIPRRWRRRRWWVGSGSGGGILPVIKSLFAIDDDDTRLQIRYVGAADKERIYAIAVEIRRAGNSRICFRRRDMYLLHNHIWSIRIRISANSTWGNSISVSNSKPASWTRIGHNVGFVRFIHPLYSHHNILCYINI